MSKEQVADVLDAAADRIMVQGWMQGAYGDIYEGVGPVCIKGAIQCATGERESSRGNNITDQAINALRKHLTGEDKPMWTMSYGYTDHAILQKNESCWQSDPVPDWNDTPDRTEGEVIEVLKMTAKELRNEA